MEKDCGSWLHQPHMPRQSPNSICNSVLDTGWQNAFQPGLNSCVNMFSGNKTLQQYNSSESPQLKTNHSTQIRGWFYGLPRHRQALTPMPNSVPKGLSEFSCECDGEGAMRAVPRPEEKRFVVFDQSGNQTSLIYSSLVGSHPQQKIFLGNQKLPLDSLGSNSLQMPVDILQMGVGESVGDVVHKTKPICISESQEIDCESEMHEDTEELNALLFSDEDDDDDIDDYECDGDEISTGRSPTEMEGYKKQEEIEDGEEVASSPDDAATNKRKRLQNEKDWDLLPLINAVNVGGTCELNHANYPQLSCLDNRGTSSSSANNKRLKREKIKETVSILQSIIPGGKGKDAVLVLDEAIRYLRSLKLKVKSWGETLQ
ncbi:hypothetical protein Sjap_022175 [Stephania japonica]|uniref:BHLH domain-containing protein n=1 Tax=Stephania japonica TaxID=461633 RepID=A0AAP0EU30_9MAGN